MLFVDPEKYMRSRLDSKQREYLLRIVPLAGFVQQQTMNKAMATNKYTEVGVYASLITAHIIYKSEWGTHPVSLTLWKSIPANNLALIEAHKYWKKLKIIHDEIEYRGYKNWREFAVDFSDDLAWHPERYKLLLCSELTDQIKDFAEYESDSSYFDKIVSIIKDYGLREFDFCA